MNTSTHLTLSAVLIFIEIMWMEYLPLAHLIIGHLSFCVSLALRCMCFYQIFLSFKIIIRIKIFSVARIWRFCGDNIWLWLKMETSLQGSKKLVVPVAFSIGLDSSCFYQILETWFKSKHKLMKWKHISSNQLLKKQTYSST